ncbi:MAG: ATP-binding protein [Acidobacteria bacterium]|nr:ATP-binding protein [Acidobacteriota bacterium]
MSALLKEVFNVFNKEETFCSSCNNTNWQKFTKPDGSTFVKRCLENIHLVNRLLALGVYPRYQHCSFITYIPNNPIEQQAKEVIQNLTKTISQTKVGVILSSNKNNGKTHLIVSLMRAFLIETFIQPKFCNTSELLNQLDGETDLVGEKDRKLLRENILKSDLLVLDDFARVLYSEEQKINLENIIHYRHRNYLPLIITTRLNPIELNQKLTPPIYSRLEEMCEFISINSSN